MTTEARISLRKTRPDDLDSVIECERLYPRFVGQWTPEQHLRALSDPDISHLIAYVDDNPFVGFAILKGLNGSNKSIELMRVAVNEPGVGYGKMILQWIQKSAFEDMGANRLWLDVREHNSRGRHVYHGVGFVEEGTIREAVYVDGRFESLILMSILKREYEANTLKG